MMELLVILCINYLLKSMYLSKYSYFSSNKTVVYLLNDSVSGQDKLSKQIFWKFLYLSLKIVTCSLITLDPPLFSFYF